MAYCVLFYARKVRNGVLVRGPLIARRRIARDGIGAKSARLEAVKRLSKRQQKRANETETYICQ